MEPILFPIFERLANRKPSEVRQLAMRYRFKPQQSDPSAAGKPHVSQVWMYLVPDGYACLRLDKTDSSRPHYHKEWVPRAHAEDYLMIHRLAAAQRDRLAQVVVIYNDEGVRVPDTHYFEHPDESVRGDPNKLQSRLKPGAFASHQIHGRAEK